MIMDDYVVSLNWDAEAKKWFAQNDDIPILLEDISLDSLITRVDSAVPEMLALNGEPYTNINLFFKMDAQLIY